MLFSFNQSDGKNFGYGNTGLGAIIQQSKQNLTDIAALKELSRATQDYINQGQNTIYIDPDQIKGISQETSSYLTQLQQKSTDAQYTLTGLNDKINALSATSDKANSIVRRLGDTLVNAFVSLGASYIISEVISGIEAMYHSYEDLAKVAQEYSSEYMTSKKQLSDYSSEIRSLRDVLANQESTTEEVANATSRLYEIQNDLVGTYGSYASGIDLVNGKLNTQLAIMEDIDKKNAQNAINSINNERSGLSTGANAFQNIGFRSATGVFGGIGSIATTINDLPYVIGELKKGNKDLISIGKSLYTNPIFGQDLGYTLMGNSVTQITENIEDFNKSINNVNDKKLKDIVEGLDGISYTDKDLNFSGSVYEISDSIGVLQSRLEELGGYDDLIHEIQGINKDVNDIINYQGENYNTVLMDDIYNSPKLLSYYREIEAAYERINEARSNGSYEDIQEANEQYALLINRLEEGSGLEEKYINFFENLYPDLQNLVSQWELEVKIIPNMDDFTEEYLKNHTYEEIVAGINKMNSGGEVSDEERKVFNQIQKDAYASNYSDVKTYLSAIKSNKSFSDDTIHLKTLLGDNYQEGMENQFSEEQLELIAEIKPRYTEKSKIEYEEQIKKIPEGVKNILGDRLDIFKSLLKVDPYSLEEIKEEITKGINPIELEVEYKSSDLVSDLDTLEDKWDSLSTAYMASVKNEDSSGNATNNIIDASDLQAVTDDFGGIGKDSEGNYNALSTVLERYNEDLTENPGDTAIAQKSADELATAYLDLSGTLQSLIEEDADYAEQILKTNGVENAHEVVQSRLNKTYKKTRENLTKVAEAVAEYGEAFENATDKNSSDFENLVNSVKDLVGSYDQETGELVAAAENIDGDFIADNWDLIQDAISGVDGALDSLYLRVAALDAEQIFIDADIDEENYIKDLQTIEELVAYANEQDIETWAYLEDTSFMSALNRVISSSQAARDACNAAFSDIGMDITYDTTPKQITVPVVNQESGSKSTSIPTSEAAKGANGGSDVVRWDTKTITVDNVSIKASKNGKGSSGTGVKNYGGSNNSSSSQGSDGSSDGGSGDTSTDEETFDWIEVKIDRLEEQLARLDEAIDDVYDNWGNRNDKISDKIQTVTDEIETQKDASKRYLEEANKYADLIGKEYVEKVQRGEIDIETIKVETSDDDDSNTLIENIQEYQTWYEKYIEASDQVNTLSRELNSYYKDLFDNVESEYEDLLDEIEKKTDIIEERITRTEEHGFFVDEAYYTQLLELEKSNYTDLEKEREELITKLNDAVTTGKIKQGSEAWYEMYLAIQDVNKAIEESMTNTVKLNNEIRQLAWDRFDWIEDRMNDFAEEADFLIGLLQGEETFDDRGNFNNRGYANAALIGAKYDDALAEAQRYADAIKEIDKDLATKEGKYDKNLIERKEELVSAYRSAIEAAEDEKQAMKSLVEEGVKKHLEYLSKLIDKYKDALSTMKSTYEYAKNINDQTKNISNLEKQLAAYQGDTSEETRKKRQELQNQLNSAQQQLEETQWDKYISETGEMLDNLYNDYETYLNDKLSSVTELMTSMIDMINQGTYTVPGAVTLSMSSIIAQLSGNGSIATAVGDTTISIKDGMDEIKNEYGITTQKFEDFGNTANGTKDILSAWSNGKYTNESTFVSKLDDVITKFSEVTNGAADTIKNAILSKSKDITVNDNGTVSATDTYKKDNGNGGASGNGSGDDDKRPDGIDNSMHIHDVLEWGERGWTQTAEGLWRYRKDDGSYIGENTERGEWYQDEDGWWYHFDPSGVMSSNEYVEGYWLDGSGHMMPDLFKWYGDESTGWWFGTEDGSKYEKGRSVYIDGKWYDFDENGWMKYASGSRSIPTNRLAWTQDEGQELIYRTTDGALLTPLNQGDMVFTNEMSQRLWEIASGQIPIGGNIEMPIIGGGTTAGNVTANNNITIELPNVENYDDFKKAMKQDRDLEKFWQEITIGQMMGNNKLSKNKY